MQRRAVLTLLGAGLFAGCSNRGAPTDTPAGGGTADEPSDDTTTTNGSSTHAADSRFAGEPCPRLKTNVQRTVCWHATDPSTAGRYLEPSTELFQPSPGDDSVETMSFVFHNDADGPVGFNPYNWTIYRRTGEGNSQEDWERVAPEVYPEPWYQLDAGGTYTWELAVEEHPTPNAERIRYPVVDLDDGVYAFAVTVTNEAGPNSGSHISTVALFEVDRS